MTRIAQELDSRLGQVDQKTARHIELLVREALALSERAAVETDEMGYPKDYFETTAGSFAGEPLERPEVLPPEERTQW